MSKYNTINRYALIEKVKAYYDRILKNKMEVKKFEIVQEEIKNLNHGQSLNFDRSSKRKLDLKNIDKLAPEERKKIKIVHSAEKQSNLRII